ncbi:FAD-dependent oxidoreductase [uncultured Microbacterium sp.]|uniref:FAD-dependent oxidoreductase n=1 Tax=uncultured Microbacterium sp. TaxID=191216 RepID=UPI0035CC504E
MTPLWRTGRDLVAGTPFDAGAHYDVVVVGAGITGLSTALILARAGRSVAVIEQGEVGSLATGSNTGKVSLLQGTVLSTLRRHHPASFVRAYVEANRAGADWLLGFADEAGVPYTRRTAYSFATQADGERAVEDEFSAAAEAGLSVRRTREPEEDTAFPMTAAVALDDQAAIDPQAVAVALARALLAAGGVLHTGTRVTRVSAFAATGVQTDRGPVLADQVVLATGTPIADRGLTFVKTRGLRSYCVAFRTDASVPDGLYLSVDAPSRSLRSVTVADGPAAALIVGGNGHPVGRGGSEAGRIDELVTWTREWFPDATPTHRWSAQDYESHDLIPFVGALPRGFGRVRFATGFGKWGLTNGPAAGIRIAAEIVGTSRGDLPSWARTIGTRMTVPADLSRGASEAARVAAAAARGWIGAESATVPVPQPPEGAGIVANRAGAPVAISTVGGRTRAVSAVCPHLGGVLSWNDAECTWDCPLHASRFAADGTRLEGPASRDLRRLSGPSGR